VDKLGIRIKKSAGGVKIGDADFGINGKAMIS
jgi:hypothetical protein